MKYIPVILFLILIGCKSETKNENGTDKSVYTMWSNFTDSNPEYKNEALPDATTFHNNKVDANRLAELIVTGKKQAGSNLYFWYKEANAPLPQIGTKTIVTDFDGKARAIIQSKKVDTIPFNQISKEYATLDMGTDIEPLKKWKKAHWDFFSSALLESDEKPTEDMLIVCERFEVIWPK